MCPVIVHEHLGHKSLARTVSDIPVLSFCVSLLCASSTGACCEFICACDALILEEEYYRIIFMHFLV